MNRTADADRFNAICSWFLGPRAENFSYLEKFFKQALDAQKEGRNSYFPDDKIYITEEIQASSTFKENIHKLNEVVQELTNALSKHHIPFWNPRYNAHMNMDTTMPGIVGYLTTMIYNPNNVALEASPLTTIIEKVVGLQLCEMIGINTNPDNGNPIGWGHITCDGSVANLESIWAARNLKFYPLSLTLAMENMDPKKPSLRFISDSFKLPTCDGTEKYFRDFTTWELLNIRPNVVLDIPDRLYRQYHISPTFLQHTMQYYIIQTTSKDAKIFETRFGPSINEIAYIASATKHYSWPKGAAVTGIGSANLIDVYVDNDARMDMADLRRHLDECLSTKRAVYAVVAIIGSTEHGACDPLKDIVKIREEYQKKGLSFVLHADGAWGTYYHTILNQGRRVQLPIGTHHWRNKWNPSNSSHAIFPYNALKPSTRDSLLHLRYCDSVTVDPHKSGYLQYPAGGLLYRDERMRYLVTWTSPVVYRNDAESMGVYGIEGSKPGAAPVAAFVSHSVLGLDQDGYGSLLAEGIYSCVKMYAHLITMSTPSTDYRVRTLNAPPHELLGLDSDGVLKLAEELIDKEFYERDTPSQDVKESHSPWEERAIQLVELMGSDLSINAFAVNFMVDGVVNEDVVEANYLNKRIFERLSVTSMDDDLNTRPLFLTSTVFPQATYGSCLTNFKQRLGLVGDQDLYTLINVVSSPFPMMTNFTTKIARDLRQVIEEEVRVAQFRNRITPTFHGFIMQGFGPRVFLVHLPMFNMADHRYQVIITGDLPLDILEKYHAARRAHPGQYFTLGNARPAILEDMLKAGAFEAVIDVGMPPSDGTHLITGFKLTNITVVKMERLNTKYLRSYPANSMPFYLYGNGFDFHIDHALLASPNIQLDAEDVKIHLQGIGPRSSETIVSKTQDGEGAGKPPYLVGVAHFLDVRESTMQPFPTNNNIAKDPSFFFRPGATFRVHITEDLESTDVLYEGSIVLGDTLFVDTDMLNMDPHPEEHQDPKKEKEAPVDRAPQVARRLYSGVHGSFAQFANEKTEDHPTVPLLIRPKVTPSQTWLNEVNDMLAHRK